MAHDFHTDFMKTADQPAHTNIHTRKRYSRLQQCLQAWKMAFQIPFFRWAAMLTCIAGLILAYIAQLFFPYIQQRHGIVLHDPLLQWIPAYDVSAWLFACLYLPMLAWLCMLLAYPRSLLQVIMTIIILQTIRLITIWLIPLDPPAGCIVLHDPLINVIAYRHQPITHDLFFSGHTATMMAFYVAAPPRKKWWLGIWMGMVMALLLIQHAHYTIDLLAAMLISPAIWTWVDVYLSSALEQLPAWGQ